MIPGVRIAASLFLSVCALAPFHAARAQDGAAAAVQVAAVLTQADAEAEVRNLRAKGLDAYWVRAQVPGKGTRYRVRVGRFSNEAEARQLVEQACAKGAIRQFVIAQGDALPPRPSFCTAAMSAARQQTAAPVKPPTATKTVTKTAPQAAPQPQPATTTEPIAPKKDEMRKAAAPKVASGGAPVTTFTPPAIRPGAPATVTPVTPKPTPQIAADPVARPRPHVTGPGVSAPPHAAAPSNTSNASGAPAPVKPVASPATADACRMQPGLNGTAKDCRPVTPNAEAFSNAKVTNPNWAVVQGGGATDKNLRAVHFVDRLTGWAAGDGGMIYRTDDGGKNWAELPGAVVPNGVVDVSRVQFADTQTGWMLGEMRGRDGGEAQTVLLSTTDGGQIWQQQTMPGLLSFHFVSAKLGWAAGRGGGVFKTTDGGLRWKRLESIERLVAQPAESSAFNFGFSDVNFIDAEHGWAVGNFYGRARTHIGGLFVTTDGGETWRRMPIVIQAQNNATRFTRGLLHAVKFTDVNHGTVTGEMEDGEETFVFTLRTRDGGQTWEQARVPSRSIQGTQFVDAARGWAAAPAERAGSADKAVYDTVLLKTANGGQTWEPDYVARGSRVRGVFFISPTQGWAVGDGGLILRYEAKQEKASK
jgi:photosystem II stability/assembly factor-like uncharacterized protein